MLPGSLCKHHRHVKVNLNNTSKYFASFTQLVFKPGKHYLNNDLIVQNVINFSMTGKGFCKISCVLYSSIMLFNVTNFTLENIDFVLYSSITVIRTVIRTTAMIFTQLLIMITFLSVSLVVMHQYYYTTAHQW